MASFLHITATAAPRSLLSQTPHLVVKRMKSVLADGLPPELQAQADEPWLLVNASTGTWLVAQPLWLQIVRAVAQPIDFQALCLKFPAFALETLKEAVYKLYEAGIIHISGRLCPGCVPSPVIANELGTRFLAVHTTSDCSMRCRYCYNSSGASSTSVPSAMTEQSTIKFIEKACQEFSSPALTVDFLGGEPLLLFEKIKTIVEKGRQLADRYHKTIDFTLQTNGLALNRETALYLRDQRIKIGVSLDGPAALHDFCRRTATGAASHAIVLKNLLQARDLGVQVAPLAVIWDPHQYTTVLHYFVEELGFKVMRFNLFSRLGRARYCTDINNYSALEHCQGFAAMSLEALRLAKKHSIQLTIADLNAMLANLRLRQRDYMCMRSPCGMGSSILALDPDEQVYACEEYEENTRQTMRLGQLDSLNFATLTRDNAALKALRQRTCANIPSCSKCWLRHICGGGCTHKTLAAYGTIMREDPMCDFYRLVYPMLMQLLHKHPELPNYLI